MRRTDTDPLLEQILRDTPRRYRLPAPPLPQGGNDAGKPATVLALAVEQIRVSLATDETPDAALKPVFIDALAALIGDALRLRDGDPAFQAMALRHRAAPVREYASLVAQRKSDTRDLLGQVNAIAHPARLARLPQDDLRDALAQLHAGALDAVWMDVADCAEQLSSALAEAGHCATLESRLAQLRDSPALERMTRLQNLASDEQVQRYQALLDSAGPRAGSHAAAKQGAASRRRGADVETAAAQAVEALAQRLNHASSDGRRYQVATSLRAPSTLPGDPDRAKTEWDVVLLSRAPAAPDADAAWEISLLVEAKAAVDAAGADLARLLRGLRLLANAQAGQDYVFQARQGPVKLRGASLRLLPTEAACLASTVLYCCDAPADDSPRLLSAASRMQLLSAPESLDFAAALERTGHGDTRLLEPVWHQLLKTNRWDAVLQQLSGQRLARELMAHPADLLAAALR